MEQALDEAIRLRAARVRLMIFDVDGILTDGSLHFGADGEMMKRFHVLDGHGMKLLQENGIVTALLSARSSPIVGRRAADLGIPHVAQGVHDKRAALQQLCTATGIGADDCGFIGDDWLDLPVLTRIGFSASVPGAHAEVRRRVHYVTRAGGGQGAAREVCDLLLRAQDKYQGALARYLA